MMAIWTDVHERHFGDPHAQLPAEISAEFDAAVPLDFVPVAGYELTCMLDKRGDTVQDAYFSIYIWAELSRVHCDPERFHLDVDLTREDRMWEVDLMRGNAAPRLLASRCRACKACRLRPPASPRGEERGAGQPSRGPRMGPRWCPADMELAA